MDTPETRVLIPYVRKVLDAMGIKHGPSHGEVMLSPKGEPCLVEMNCRAHGGSGTWRQLCNALTGGYSQVEATIYAYVEPEKFDKLPDRPSRYLASGQEVILVSYKSGTVRSTPGFDLIRSLPSFVSLETSVHIGSMVSPSIDLETDCGSVILIHPNPTVLQRDVDLIRSLESDHCLFDLEGDIVFKAHSPTWNETIHFGIDGVTSAARSQLPPSALRRRMSAVIDPR
jgi:biotin carboxylase